MTLLEHRRDEIEKKIFRFFSECRTPDVRNIVTESSFLDLEKVATCNLLKGKDWREIDFKWLCSSYTGDISAILNWLTVESFEYFYPAFLRVTLLEFELADITALSSATWFSKFKYNFEDLDAFVQSRISRFNRNQLQTILLVFRYAREVYDHDDSTLEDAIGTVEELLQ
jgi:hypothetical protein